MRVSHEDRDVWMLFLEKALAGEEEHFESAAEHCKNATERAQVETPWAGFLSSTQESAGRGLKGLGAGDSPMNLPNFSPGVRASERCRTAGR